MGNDQETPASGSDAESTENKSAKPAPLGQAPQRGGDGDQNPDHV